MVKMGQKRTEHRKPIKKKMPKDYLLDGLCSKVVRGLAGNKCQVCGQSPKLLHAHHWIGRRYHATRWMLENLICVCHNCHQDIHDFPKFKQDVIKKTIGTDRIEQLEIIARSRTKPEKESIKQDFKERLRGLEDGSR